MMGYIGNTRTHIYHEIGCRFAPTENKKIILRTEKYTPCSFCKPNHEQETFEEEVQ